MLIALALLVVSILAIGFIISVRWARRERAYTAARKLQRALEYSPGARLAITTPKVDDLADGVLRVAGRVNVDVIDLDGKTTETFRTGTMVFDLKVNRGTAAACEIDGVRTILVHVVGGEVDCVDLELTSGVRIASANL